MLKPCIECGAVAEGTRCAQHQAEHDQQRQRAYPKESSTARGYDAAWKRISSEARRRQPFCSDCGATTDLTADHSEQAWRAWIDSRAITLEMVDVVCRSCNVRRGNPFAEGDDPRLGADRPTAGQGVSDTSPSARVGNARRSAQSVQQDEKRGDDENTPGEKVNEVDGLRLKANVALTPVGGEKRLGAGPNEGKYCGSDEHGNTLS